MKKGGSGGNGGAPGHFEDAHDLDLDSDLDSVDSKGGIKESDDDDEDDKKKKLLRRAPGTLARAKNLNEIKSEDEMAPMVLPQDPKVARLASKRRVERSDRRKKSAALMGRPILSLALFSMLIIL